MPIPSLVLALAAAALSPAALASSYAIDPGHSFVQFRIQHLGFSWLFGRFNTLSGEFHHDPANPQSNSITMEVETASIDTNHAERDKHLRSSDFLDVSAHPKAIFRSTAYTGGANEGVVEGELTLAGVTRPVRIEVKKLGEGKDPWGGHRSGFIGTLEIDRRDFGIDYDLGPAAWTMQLELGIEGVRK